MLIQSWKLSGFRSEESSEIVYSVPEDKKVETPVDFVALKKENPDIHAWINIPDTNVDYPILQRSDDNSYYLKRTIDGAVATCGSIFTENYNNTDFNDFNTVIYGHNMKNGTMFGSLKKYKDQVYYDANRYINVYLPGRILKYQIFAAYTWDNRHILLSLDFSSMAIRKAYIDMIYSIRGMTSHISNDVTVTENDKIITLSTCTSSDDQRFLVQGVLIYDSEKQ